ncbi:EAL domain-containing protein [Neobacillus drentensis]|uniref:EAL domain-containing protein n=1 Tax=Neobacillus drentensis TaxID=220684 RepID=UPI0028676273|nr:EAL domain-containing protein [Neobacillus drentensis]MDR7238777.1 diguanylate cyclase (GGDEF)-like protein/PAS domain S-box-containing protein [Neobacillus drentensis]
MKNFFQKIKEPLVSSTNITKNFHPEILDYLNSVIILDINGNFVSYNDTFAKQYGYNKQDFKKTFLDVFFKSETFKEKRAFEKAILGKKQTFDTIGLCKDGKTVNINVVMIPIKNKIYVIIKYITEYIEQDRELHLSPKRQADFNMMKNICDFSYDAINDQFYFSNQMPTILGIGIKERKTSPPTLNKLLWYVHPDDRNLVKDTIQNALSNNTGYTMEFRILRKDQSIRYIYQKSEIAISEKGHSDGLIGIIQDITDSKILEDALEKEDQLTQLYDNPDVGIWTIDVQTGRCLSRSRGIESISGYTTEDFNNGIQWSSIVHSEDLSQYLDNQYKLASGNILRHQYRIIHKNGDIRWVQDYTIPKLDHNGSLSKLIGLTSDITDQMVLNEKIKYLSDYDDLTKLPKRKKFIESLEQLTAQYANGNNQFAVMKLDVDRFKYVNDTLGQQVGDELLIQISDRLSKHLTPQDLLARRSGDQFLILIRKLNSIESLKIIVNNMHECINEPFYIKEYHLYITMSIGISTYPENGVTSLELLRNASLALYQSQKKGKNNYHILSHSSSIQSFKSYSIGRDLKKAVENNEMILYYQSRVDTYSNQIIAAEALIRWNHPEWGLISPHEFLSIAEENGLITDIDDWVLKEACNQIKKWKEEQLHTVPISINISAVHFMKRDWSRTVAKVIQDAGIQPYDLEFEITESTVLNTESMVRDTINSLRDLGISIALDDFGVGYSSISYLNQFPFDVIKIDKSFIRNMLLSDKNLHIAKSIIYMAKGLQIRVVAEGVETIQQLKVLQKEQCQEIQGYLFSHPVPVDEFETLLQKRILPPLDPELKAKQNKRKHYRLNFPYPLEADMTLVSISGRNMALGKSNVLIHDMSIGGLRYVSTLKLPVRGDVLFQFETEILGKIIKMDGSIVWKEEINDDLTEYGIQFRFGKDEQAALSRLLNTFEYLLKNSNKLPSYRVVKEDPYQYFRRDNNN